MKIVFSRVIGERQSPARPILTDALAWLDCTIFGRYPAGTHTIYVGRVQASGVPRPDCPPLVYWNRGYRQLRFDDMADPHAHESEK